MSLYAIRHRTAVPVHVYQTTMSPPEDVLVTFRAGLMKPENNTLKADQRKGLVQVVQVLNVATSGCDYNFADTNAVCVQSADGLTHFRWHERIGAEPQQPAQHDVIVFPGEAVYKKVVCEVWPALYTVVK